jgi:hypothetical protein
VHIIFHNQWKFSLFFKISGGLASTGVFTPAAKCFTTLPAAAGLISQRAEQNPSKNELIIANVHARRLDNLHAGREIHPC